MRFYVFLFALSIFLVSTSLGWTDVNTWLKPPPTGSDGSKNEESSLPESAETPPEEVIYSFLQSFQEAKAQKLEKGRYIKGLWQENGFQFEDSTGLLMKDIFLSDAINVNGRQRNAIWFLIGPGYESLLRFQGVPPGKRLRLYYALQDEAFLEKVPAFVQVEARIGKKKLFEVQINTKGWKEKTADLTLSFLLHHNYDVTITVHSLDPEPKLLGLYGHIE